MAHTARSDEEKREYFDPPDVLEEKVDTLVQWIKDSKHMIAFTGAGISTGAGIPDFRSGMDTKLSTGPGAWELRAQGASRDRAKYRTTSTTKAIPTPTHMMFVKLQEEGILKFCVSQNTDGLHRRSGLPKTALAELHGNSNLEVCQKCGREYLRDFPTRTAFGIFAHETGRKCDDRKCRGPLCDTIINFGENLPEADLNKSFKEGGIADLCLAMGSSLTVTPAAHIPRLVSESGRKLVIVNLQRTALHSMGTLCIHAKCEEVSTMVMKKLGLPIPEFRLKRLVLITTSHCEDKGEVEVAIEGQDAFGYIFSFLTGVDVTENGGHGRTHHLREPFGIKLPWKPTDPSGEEMKVELTFHFQGHYGEPSIARNLVIKKGMKDKLSYLKLSYNPFNGQWTVTDEESKVEGEDRVFEQLEKASIN